MGLSRDNLIAYFVDDSTEFDRLLYARIVSAIINFIDVVDAR